MANFLNNILFIFQRLDWLSVLDILLVTLIFFVVLYSLRDTQAMILLRGMIFLVIALVLLTTVVELPAFSWLVQSTLPALLLAIPVIFAPEIRRTGTREVLARSLESNDGVYFVPALTGLGSPHWDPYARGTIVGLTRGSTIEHIVFTFGISGVSRTLSHQLVRHRAGVAFDQQSQRYVKFKDAAHFEAKGLFFDLCNFTTESWSHKSIFTINKTESTTGVVEIQRWERLSPLHQIISFCT